MCVFCLEATPYWNKVYKCIYIYEYTFLHHLLSLILIIEWNFDQVQTDDDAGSLLSNQMFEDGKTCEFILLSNEMEQQKSQSQKKPLLDF